VDARKSPAEDRLAGAGQGGNADDEIDIDTADDNDLSASCAGRGGMVGHRTASV
jgi:hypothetical protein